MIETSGCAPNNRTSSNDSYSCARRICTSSPMHLKARSVKIVEMVFVGRHRAGSVREYTDDDSRAVAGTCDDGRGCVGEASTTYKRLLPPARS